MWFKRAPVGVNKLSSLMKRMIQGAEINPNKKLSNHSARKFLIQKLNDHNVPPTQIMQISGHKNLGSINNYSHINQNQHKEISNILYSNTASTSSRENLLPVSQSYAAQVRNDSTSNLRVTGGLINIFGAPVYGGTFNIHIHQNDCQKSTSPMRKRIRIDTDSESD